MNNFDIFTNTFKEEAYELLSELEQSLLVLEENPEDSDLIARIFRAMHTLKGSGNMFGFVNIGKFTHDIETVFDRVRDGKISVTRELVDLTLSACDQIRIMLEEKDPGTVRDNEKCMEISSSFKRFLPEEESKVKERAEKFSVKEKKGNITYRISFQPAQDIFNYGTNPIYLLDELSEMGHCTVTAKREHIPLLEHYNPDSCYTGWDIILTTDKDINTIKDVFIFVEDGAELTVEIVDKETATPETEEIMFQKVDDKKPQIQKQITEEKKKGDISVDRGAVFTDPSQEKIKDLSSKRQSDEGVTSIRVPSEKLDKLVNLVGEIVINQAQVFQAVSDIKDLALRASVKKMENLIVDLRNMTLNIRMVPIGTIFGKFRRLVRDLSKDLGKEVELITEGDDTELDKTVIERLQDPLVHLIRNSMDHGIEDPGERKKKGKESGGKIHLMAIHSGAEVLIKINDDGKGLRREPIYAKALSKGLITSGKELSNNDIFNLILLPGFSTATEITNVSGRGVGMDVVKKTIDSLGGAIEIDSKEDIGTEITLKLPLTLAIIEGLVASIDDDYFVFPLSAVERNVELTASDIKKAHGRHIIKVRDQIIPYIRLRESFNIKANNAVTREQIVITRMNGHKVGFVVDKVIGTQQTVIKSLNRVFQKAKLFSGATILGNGRVALILDVIQLIKDGEIQNV
jgi:two-component system chemotaxis sensor kinase CheA